MITLSLWKAAKEGVIYGKKDEEESILAVFCLIIATPITVFVDILGLPIEILILLAKKIVEKWEE